MGQYHGSLNNAAPTSRPGPPASRAVQALSAFNDLNELPPELAITILSKLNATDLCLAACVWKELAEDELLWKGLLRSRWNYVTEFNRKHHCYSNSKKRSYKTVYLILDEATLIFKCEPEEGIAHLIKEGVLGDSPEEIALFLNGTEALCWKSVRNYLEFRRDILDELVAMQDFTDMNMIDALRKFFKKLTPNEERREYLDLLVEKFAHRYLECNEDSVHISRENISLLCYSLLLLSVDLYSPHNRSKMTKREFIRNNRHVIPEVSAEFVGDLYDEVYLNGHIAGREAPVNSVHEKQKQRTCFPFLRPYGALFELSHKAPSTTTQCIAWCNC